MPFRAGVLFTKHLTKKRKAWLDGSVTVTAERWATLTDEEGRALATARVPSSEHWTADTEGIVARLACAVTVCCSARN